MTPDEQRNAGGKSIVSNNKRRYAATFLVNNDADPLLYGILLLLASLPQIPAAPFLYTKDAVTLWGHRSQQVGAIPAGLTDIVSIEGGESYCVALKANGTIAAWGANTYGQLSIPSDARDIVAISVAQHHALGLKADGTVIRWGFSGAGLNPLPEGLQNITSIATGFDHGMALKSDGTVTVWGGRATAVPEGELPYVQWIPPSLTGVSVIAGGDFNCAALGNASYMDLTLTKRAGGNGNVITWGAYANELTQPINFWEQWDCTAIYISTNTLIGILPNRTIVMGGVTGRAKPPLGLNEVTAVTMTDEVGLEVNAMALKSNGTVVVWADESDFFHPYRDGAAAVNATGNNDVGLIGSGGGFLIAVRQPRIPSQANSVIGQSFSLRIPPRLAMPSYSASGLPHGLRINANTGVISGVPGTKGIWNAIIQAKNIHKTLTFPIRFLIDSRAYGSWGSAFWTPETLATASNDDPDGDGLQNGVEYALGTNPLLPDPSIFQQIRRDQNGCLSLSLDLPSSRTGLVQWKAEFSSTLAFSSASEALPVEESGAATGFVRYRFTDPASSTAIKRFARLKAVLP